MSVGALGAFGPDAPSFRVRTKIPSAEIARHGVAIEHLPLFTAEDDRRFRQAGLATRAQIALKARGRLKRALASPGWQVALVQRQVDMLPTLELERLAAKDRRLVLDIDDAIWLDRSRQAAAHPLAILKGTPRKVRWLAERADAVIAGNELLAEWLRAYSSAVTVVPSLVEHRAIPMRAHEERDRVVLGWIGSSSTAPYLRRLTNSLRRLAAACPGMHLELLTVGGEAPPVAGLEVRSEPWSEERERRFLGEVDIGLMPLEDSPWARGKCSYKALQYMAAGIPVVADDVGISADVIGHERGGFIARSEHDWVEQLAALARNAELRARLGANGREQVEAGFSVERWAPELAAILRGRANTGR